MPNLHSASLCALFVFVLFSCNTKTKEKTSGNKFPVSSEVANISPQESLDIDALHAKFIDASTQHFSVSSGRISAITSKGGLKLTINPSLLENEDGSAMKGNINVSIIEFTNTQDLFKSNAATISNGKLLASGGSYFIGMVNGKNKIRIKKGKSIQVEFPMLKKDDMELFYGERDQSNNMNWQPAKMQLEKQNESISFTDNNSWETSPVSEPLGEIIDPKIYKSLDEAVYYYRTRMSLSALVDTLNKNGTKVYLQTISYWPTNLPTDQVLDTNYLTMLYGPRRQYILRGYKQEEEERKALEKRKAEQKAILAKWQPRSLAGQIQKYYAPSNITSLGWINCDKFYNVPTESNTEVEFPYAFHNTHVEYFLLFKSFNGMVNGKTEVNNNARLALEKMPVGESVTLIAFTKMNGTIYQAKEDFVTGKDKKLPVSFKQISSEEITKIFGANVRI